MLNRVQLAASLSCAALCCVRLFGCAAVKLSSACGTHRLCYSSRGSFRIHSEHPYIDRRSRCCPYNYFAFIIRKSKSLCTMTTLRLRLRLCLCFCFCFCFCQWLWLWSCALAAYHQSVRRSQSYWSCCRLSVATPAPQNYYNNNNNKNKAQTSNPTADDNPDDRPTT